MCESHHAIATIAYFALSRSPHLQCFKSGPGYVAGVAHGEAREVEADLPGDGAQPRGPRPGSGLEILVALVESAALVVVIVVVTVGGVLAVVAVAKTAPASVGEGRNKSRIENRLGDKYRY